MISFHEKQNGRNAIFFRQEEAPMTERRMSQVHAWITEKSKTIGNARGPLPVVQAHVHIVGQ